MRVEPSCTLEQVTRKDSQGNSRTIPFWKTNTGNIYIAPEIYIPKVFEMPFVINGLAGNVSVHYDFDLAMTENAKEDIHFLESRHPGYQVHSIYTKEHFRLSTPEEGPKMTLHDFSIDRASIEADQINGRLLEHLFDDMGILLDGHFEPPTPCKEAGGGFRQVQLKKEGSDVNSIYEIRKFVSLMTSDELRKLDQLANLKRDGHPKHDAPPLTEGEKKMIREVMLIHGKYLPKKEILEATCSYLAEKCPKTYEELVDMAVQKYSDSFPRRNSPASDLVLMGINHTFDSTNMLIRNFFSNIRLENLPEEHMAREHEIERRDSVLRTKYDPVIDEHLKKFPFQTTILTIHGNSLYLPYSRNPLATREALDAVRQTQ